jgi:hypothetical protein
VVTGIVGSNPDRGLGVCHCVYVVLCHAGRDLYDGLIIHPRKHYRSVLISIAFRPADIWQKVDINSI